MDRLSRYCLAIAVPNQTSRLEGHDEFALFEQILGHENSTQAHFSQQVEGFIPFLRLDAINREYDSAQLLQLFD